MSGGYLPERAVLAVEQPDGLLGTAVDRIDQIEREEPEVVVGPRLDEHLLDGARRGVAPRLDEHHRRRLIGQHVDGVLRRRRDELAVGPLQVDAVEAILLDHEARRQRAVGRHLQRLPTILVEHEIAAGRRHRRDGPQPDFRVPEHGDVAAVLDDARVESRVGREDVLELELRHVGQVDDVEREPGRLHAGRLDEVVRAGPQIEQQDLEEVGVFHRHQRQRLERRARAAAHEQVDVVGVEPEQPGGDRLVGPARHGGVARQHLDLVRARRLDVADGSQQRGDAVPQVVGAEDEQHHGRGRGGAEQPGRPRQPAALDGAPHVHVAHLRHGRLDQAPHDQRRVIATRGPLALAALLDGAQHDGLQRRLVLLQVERDPLVGHAPRHRPHEQPPAGADQHEVGRDAKAHDRGRAEPEQLEAVRRGEEGAERGGDENRDAPDGDPQAPAVPHVPNDPEDLGRAAGEPGSVVCHPHGPFILLPLLDVENAP